MREPDAQLGFIWGPFTMRQTLCFVMVSAGLVIFALRKGRKHGMVNWFSQGKGGMVSDN